MENDKKEKHPAHAVISISRTSGLTHLFRSDFNHHNWISMTISTAHEYEGYGVDSRVMSENEIIEVWMSEAQFARMITTPNMGGGTPCTLHAIRVPESLKEFDGMLPQVKVEDVRKTHKDKIKEVVTERLDRLDALEAQLRGWREAKHRPTMKELDEVVSNLSSLHLAGNFAYLQQVLEEKMEQTIEEGRTEIEAHIAQLAKQVGLDTIKQAQLPDLPHQKTIEQKNE